MIKTTDSEFKERFWEQVGPKHNCWIWRGNLVHNGYGVFYSRLDGAKYWRAHRYSYALHKGPIPDGMNVLHTCDNRPCVNPDHLFLGDQGVNLRDAAAKGRITGANNANAKLSNDDVLSIRASDKSVPELAAQYDIHPTHIARIINREKWTHI